MYEMDLRQYDPSIGRWIVQDPVVHHDFSPYSAFDNNPVYWADPSGADFQPTGNSIDIDKLFKDSEHGDTYEMIGGKLTYSGKQTEAQIQQFYEFVSLNEGSGGGNHNPNNTKKYANYNDYFNKELQHIFLNRFTFEDAIYHYNFGKGESVTVKLSQLNFDGITVERFLKSKEFHQGHPKITVNFLGADMKGTRNEQGLIYGNITLVYIGNNKIMALTDQYNFEMHGNAISKRNLLTFLGGLYNGSGTPYYINFQGTATIKRK